MSAVVACAALALGGVPATLPAAQAVTPGETFTYTLSVKNNGPAVAHNVTTTDNLPAHVSFVSSPDGCTAAGQAVSCGPEATLAVGQTKSWRVIVKLDPAYTGDGSDLGNVATAKSDNNDTNPANNSNSPVLPAGPFTPLADLSVTKVPVGGAIGPGETFQYTVTATNAGPSTAVNARATDTLPAPLTFVSSADGCTASGQTVSCGPEATLAPGSSKSWTFTVRLDPAYTGNGSDIANQATVSSDTTDPNTTNSTGPTPGAGLPGGASSPGNADLEVSKTVDSTPATTAAAPAAAPSTAAAPAAAAPKAAQPAARSAGALGSPRLPGAPRLRTEKTQETVK
ncbi:DUF11 domain-containing protein [Streptomyces laurentii]|uniref:DUF11 domain-containing protein n=1 Tax=Streptomyces laurentii TaxID=39478 RepID=UPI00367C38C6